MRRVAIGWLPILVCGGLFLQADDAPRQPESRDAARQVVADPQASVADRVAAVRSLDRGADTPEEDLRRMAALLIPQTPLEIQLAAVRTLGDLPHGQVSELLLCNWTNHGPQVHTAVVAALLWREPWTGAVRDDAGSRPELAAALDWARRDISLRHPSAGLRRRAEMLLGRRSPAPEIQKALDRFQPALRRNGDVPRGRQVFVEATCAKCHQAEGVGRDLGCDLSRLADKSPRTLLRDTIDPNRVCDHRFLEYTAVTAQGRVSTGMLLDETSDSLTMADVNGETRILREDLEELAGRNRSQMPEGLEANLTLQQMADLLVFLGNLRATTAPEPLREVRR